MAWIFHKRKAESLVQEKILVAYAHARDLEPVSHICQTYQQFIEINHDIRPGLNGGLAYPPYAGEIFDKGKDIIEHGSDHIRLPVLVGWTEVHAGVFSHRSRNRPEEKLRNLACSTGPDHDTDHLMAVPCQHLLQRHGLGHVPPAFSLHYKQISHIRISLLSSCHHHPPQGRKGILPSLPN